MGHFVLLKPAISASIWLQKPLNLQLIAYLQCQARFCVSFVRVNILLEHRRTDVDSSRANCGAPGLLNRCTEGLGYLQLGITSVCWVCAIDNVIVLRGDNRS